MQRLLGRGERRLLPELATRDLGQIASKRSRDDFESSEDAHSEWEVWKDFVLKIPLGRAISSFERSLPWNPRHARVRFRKLVIQQIRDDFANAAFAPQLSLADEEAWIDPTTNSPIQLQTSPIAHTETSSIFGIDDTRVVKYQTDCFGGMFHPLLIDFWFLRKIEYLHVAPAVHFVSPPVGFPKFFSKKFQPRMEPATRLACSKVATVRYMVMDRVRTSFHRLGERHPSGRIPFIDGVRLAMHAIDVLRILHEEGGVAHGDVHSGNLVIGSKGEVLLLDFGSAFFWSDRISAKQTKRAPFSWNHPLFSPWDIEGLLPGRRDDVFKVLLTISFLINGAHYMAYLQANNENSLLCHKLKAEENFFISPQFDPTWGLPGRTQILHLLEQALASVRSLRSPRDRPPYESLIASFVAIEVLVEGVT